MILIGLGLFHSLYARVLSFNDQIELAEKIHETLDDIWRQQDFAEYPQKRMQHILSIISDDLVACIQNYLSQFDMMNDYLVKLSETLRNGLQVCEALLSTFDALTAKIWPNTMVNRWCGEAFVSRSLQKLSERIEAVTVYL